MAARRNPKLNRARAFYRLAAKAERAGQYRSAEVYRNNADRLVLSARGDKETRERREAADKAWREKAAARKANNQPEAK